MRLKFHDDFKEDYLRVIKLVNAPKRLDRELKTVARALQSGKKLPDKYVTNKILCEGVGWYECFVYHDRKYTIIVQYKIQGLCVCLARIGTPSALTRKKKFFLK